MKGRRYRLAVLNTATSREIPYKSLFIAEKINFFNGEDVPASHVWLLERKGNLHVLIVMVLLSS